MQHMLKELYRASPLQSDSSGAKPIGQIGQHMRRHTHTRIQINNLLRTWATDWKLEEMHLVGYQFLCVSLGHLWISLGQLLEHENLTWFKTW